MRKPAETKRVDHVVASGFVSRSEKTSWSSLEEKRQLVHEIAQCLDDAPAVLKSFKRKELLELIRAEVGKECKCTGFKKPKLIEYLLELVTRKCNKETAKDLAPSSPSQDEKKFYKQQKNKYLSQLPTESDRPFVETMVEDEKLLVCGNLACRAALNTDDVFCKRCSCCICHQYDENKDPSLWLTCDYNYPREREPCGMSFHLKCALEHEPLGMMNQDASTNLDGYFCCVSCRKPIDLMRTWRKQLVVAKEARRVDILCVRLSLSSKILVGTNKYKEFLKIVESAVEVLENEVGPLHQASATMDRRIVNRLSCGAQVQKLCASAVEAFDCMTDSQYFDHANQMGSPAIKIHTEASSPAKVTIVFEYEECVLKDILGCRLWYRRYDMDYSLEPTYTAPAPLERFDLCDLDPSTQYFCKILFDGETRSALWVCESNWITPAAFVKKQAAGENTNEHDTQMQTESMNSSDSKVALSDDHSKGLSFNDYGNKSDGSPALPSLTKNASLASPSSNAPSTPCKSDGTTGIPPLVGKWQVKETDYEYAVKVIRKLEHEGHLGSDFRVKFLTWFSLKATVQEKRVVSVFVNTFIDDPPSLAGQLLDTFKDEVCSEKKLASSNRFCTRLWH